MYIEWTQIVIKFTICKINSQCLVVLQGPPFLSQMGKYHESQDDNNEKENKDYYEIGDADTNDDNEYNNEEWEWENKEAD